MELTKEQKEGLEKLLKPFGESEISKLPKPTKAQTEEVKRDFKKGMRCGICGGWHHKNVVHLDYVGHAALTKRFLDVDPLWNWEPMALDPITGMPHFVNDGMWIKLTICGVTRLGFGDAQGKTGPNAIKEVIGDALRNGGMRFGCALDLWHKGDLHGDPVADEAQPEKEANQPEDRKSIDAWLAWVDGFSKGEFPLSQFLSACAEHLDPVVAKFSDKHRKEIMIAKNEMVTFLTEKESK